MSRKLRRRQVIRDAPPNIVGYRDGYGAGCGGQDVGGEAWWPTLDRPDDVRRYASGFRPGYSDGQHAKRDGIKGLEGDGYPTGGWRNGFRDGYARKSKAYPNPDYQDGYKAGEEARRKGNDEG